MTYSLTGEILAVAVSRYSLLIAASFSASAPSPRQVSDWMEKRTRHSSPEVDFPLFRQQCLIPVKLPPSPPCCMAIFPMVDSSIV